MEDIINTLKKNGGYLTTRMAQGEGRGFYYNLLSLCEKGKIVKVKRGLYALPDAMANAMVDIDKLVQGGVLCLYSAWFHYGLTTEIPGAYYVAIDSKRKVTLPEYPPIELFYWKDNYLDLGVETANINGYDVKIYDIEKSVCDAIRLRNKIGVGECAEILRNYLSRKDSNIPKLMEYGSILRVSQTLNRYLEIQVWQ